jgi:hypothetical protein
MRMARLGRHETNNGEVKGWNKTMPLQDCSVQPQAMISTFRWSPGVARTGGARGAVVTATTAGAAQWRRAD